ncbi:Aste57867_9469 [Aphanomyces stellatus]|uniref:Aste57867_9469 protein n=1 Tax=Aphanomyces stellatus TaxID=120398 RepID=A0A485KMV4_9STRA|nr:hypothetical protein As57867_009432 [Aphanomyces stellatus]VFT86348.1 Aste57867_9469 [Aphanomyces stellatus]
MAVAEPQPQQTPREFLTSARWTRGGEYTCLRVVNQRISMWDFHQRRLLVPDAAAGDLLEQEILAAVDSAHLDAPVMVTVLCADNAYRIHVCKMPSLRMDVASGNVQPISVLVHGRPRTNAHVKHVQWIQDRAPLESHARARATALHLPEPFGEVLLHAASTDGTTRLLEGLITNFFVLENHGTLVTADADILPGSTRALVLEACSRLRIPVRLEAPCLQDAATWSAAFVTSVVKIIVPVRALYTDEDDFVQTIPSSSPIVSNLRAAVLADLQAPPT